MNILSSASMTKLKWSLETNTRNYQKSLEKVSSGKKFTECSDDVIAYATSAKLGKNLSQNSVITDGISTAKDVINDASNMQENVLSNLTRISELAMQASNETYSLSEKADILDEIRSRLEYIDYVASNTDFNGTNLLDGSCTSFNVQITGKQTMDISGAFTDVHAVALGIDIDPAITAETWTTADIQTYISSVDSATSLMTNQLAKAGAYSMSLDNALGQSEDLGASYTEFQSVVSDADYAKITSELVKNQVMQELAVNMVVQSSQLSASAFSLLSPYN